MGLLKPVRSHLTKNVVATQRFLTGVEPSFFAEYVRDLKAAPKRVGSSRKGKVRVGFFHVAGKEGELIRWCWGLQGLNGGPITPMWVCAVILDGNIRDGLRRGALTTPAWKESNGALVYGDEYKIGRESLFARLQAADPRFHLIVGS